MPQDRIVNLVSLVYEAAHDPAGWNAVLQEIVDLTGATGADVAAYDLEHSRATIHTSVGTMNADFKRDYEAVAHIDPFVIRARDRRLLQTGIVGLGEEVVPLRELERTEFYSAFGRRHGYIGGLAAIIAASPRAIAAIGVSRRRDREFGTREVALMRTLMPHLQRAWAIHLRLANRERERASFAEALNRMALATLMVGHGGTIVFANEAARAVLAAGDGLIDDRGVLKGARCQDTSALQALIAGALQTAASQGLDAGGVLQLGRPSGRRPLRVLVSPLPTNDALATGEPRALLFVTDPEDRREPDAAILRQAFGLTPCETEIASLLMQDVSVNDITGWLGVSVHTVRFHIKQLLAKTGTTRQGALVRMLSATAQVRKL